MPSFPLYLLSVHYIFTPNYLLHLTAILPCCRYSTRSSQSIVTDTRQMLHYSVTAEATPSNHIPHCMCEVCPPYVSVFSVLQSWTCNYSFLFFVVSCCCFFNLWIRSDSYHQFNYLCWSTVLPAFLPSLQLYIYWY